MIKKSSIILSPIGAMSGTDLAWKRTFDVVLSSLILLLTLPLSALAALAIALEDGGPILATRIRIGHHGRRFELLSFRTLRIDADLAARNGDRDDNEAELTLVGGFLKFCRIDDIPQLLNIIAGDMSLIGPKPVSARLRNVWTQRLPLFENRYAVKPGLIGCTRDRYPDAESLAEARDMLKYDLDYVARQSLAEDFAILASTVTDPRWLQSEDA